MPTKILDRVFFFIGPKGQLISKFLFGVIISTKIAMKIFLGFLPLKFLWLPWGFLEAFWGFLQAVLILNTY